MEMLKFEWDENKNQSSEVIHIETEKAVQKYCKENELTLSYLQLSPIYLQLNRR